MFQPEGYCIILWKHLISAINSYLLFNIAVIFKNYLCIRYHLIYFFQDKLSSAILFVGSKMQLLAIMQLLIKCWLFSCSSIFFWIANVFATIFCLILHYYTGALIENVSTEPRNCNLQQQINFLLTIFEKIVTFSNTL